MISWYADVAARELAERELEQVLADQAIADMAADDDHADDAASQNPFDAIADHLQAARLHLAAGMSAVFGVQ